ncbi:hypothetical protein [Roseibium sp.]|uniref:hypothetical protein n=1 Tax=Roseibium sp. TaxID=1936156 RepID=UPI003A975758
MKRLVVYCPGYDLRSAKQCFPLFQSQFEKFQKTNGVKGAFDSFEDGHDPGGSTASWRGILEWPEDTVETRFVQLGWRDVIRPDFERRLPVRMLDAVRSFYRYARAGGYSAVIKSNWAHALFVLYPPVGFLILCLFGLLPPVLLAPVIAESVEMMVPMQGKRIVSWSAVLAGSLLWVAAVYGVTRVLEPKTYFWYLVNSWHFMAKLADETHQEILVRIDELADLIIEMECQADDEEELIFLAHSVGTFLAIYILAAVLRKKPEIGQRAGGFSFLTLGPAFDCIGGFGVNGGFSRAMATVAKSGVDWTDVYGPHDIICGGRTDPVNRYALPDKPGERLREPRRFSICIPDRLPPGQYRQLRHRFFKLHFVYFFASLRDDLFDFYRLTLGPLAARQQLEIWADRKAPRPGYAGRHSRQ